MQIFNKKTLIIALLMTSLLVVWFIKTNYKPTPLNQVAKPSQAEDDKKPHIISTKPDPLDETIIAADQTVEITFNKPLQNVPEFKVRIEPKIEFKVELSADRKTARIKPVKPFNLGSSYTLTINPDTKFDGVGEWGQTKDFHFRTITYKGV